LRGRQSARIRPDWWSKTLAGVVLGLTLAFAGSGLFLLLTPELEGSVQAQLAMWLVMPLWMLVFSMCYFFRSGLHAWLCLGLANLMCWSPLIISRIL